MADFKTYLKSRQNVKESNISSNVKPFMKKSVISTKHKIKFSKNKKSVKRNNLKLNKETKTQMIQCNTNTNPSFYPTPQYLVKSRCYEKKGIHPVVCSVCKGGRNNTFKSDL